MSRTAGKGKKVPMNMKSAYRATYAVIFLLLAVAALHSGIVPTRSIEVAFTDIAPNGLAIVPASCPSAAPIAPGATIGGKSLAYTGYEVTTNSTGEGVYNSGFGYCVVNPKSSTYFVPANTTAELNAFFNSFTSVTTNIYSVTTYTRPDGVSYYNSGTY